MKDRYYFAYGSNMNLEQMKYRCPAAEVVENVRLEAMSKESYGKSQKRVRRVWIFMKDSQVFMGKNRFG